MVTPVVYACEMCTWEWEWELHSNTLYLALHLALKVDLKARCKVNFEVQSEMHFFINCVPSTPHLSCSNMEQARSVPAARAVVGTQFFTNLISQLHFAPQSEVQSDRTFQIGCGTNYRI